MNKPRFIPRRAASYRVFLVLYYVREITDQVAARTKKYLDHERRMTAVPLRDPSKGTKRWLDQPRGITDAPALDWSILYETKYDRLITITEAMTICGQSGKDQRDAWRSRIRRKHIPYTRQLMTVQFLTPDGKVRNAETNAYLLAVETVLWFKRRAEDPARPHKHRLIVRKATNVRGVPIEYVSQGVDNLWQWVYDQGVEQKNEKRERTD